MHPWLGFHHHHHHHQSLYREGRWGTTDHFATSFLHFPLFSTALWDLPNSRPVHSLMLSSHLFLCPPCLLPPFTVPCKMVLARPVGVGVIGFSQHRRFQLLSEFGHCQYLRFQQLLSWISVTVHAANFRLCQCHSCQSPSVLLLVLISVADLG